jgi:hypothetical protein
VADDFAVASAATAHVQGGADRHKRRPGPGPATGTSAGASATLPPLLGDETDAAPRAPLRDADPDER